MSEEEKKYWILDLDGNQLELVQAEAFQMVSEGNAKFVNQGVDWDEYVAWKKGQEFNGKS